MKILGITTSSSICGIAILDNEKIIKEINLNNGLTHSETLLPLINNILKDTNLNLQDIDLLATDIGPGSFTGIRIGISTIKAFCDSLNLQSYGVSSLEALTLNSEKSGLNCSIIDAKHENIYSQIFEIVNKEAIPKSNSSFSTIYDFIENLKPLASNSSISFVGDGAKAYKDILLESFPNCTICNDTNLYAKNFALIALKKYNIQKESSIQPLYIKKSEAEINLEKKNES